MPREYLCRIALSFIMVLLSSCGGGGDPTVPFGDSYEVDPVFEESRAQTAIVPPEGGTIVVTSADGDEIRVSIPAGARSGATQLTVVPVTGIAGTPFDGIAAAVEIRPKGVLFGKPLQIEITPANSISGAGMAFIMDDIPPAAGTRANQATPVQIAPGLFTIDCGSETLTWRIGTPATGIFGIGEIPFPRVRAFLDPQSTATPLAMQIQQAYNSRIWSEANLNAFAASGCSPDTLTDSAKTILGDLFSTVLSPALEAAQTDHNKFFEVLAAYLTWKVLVAEAGLGDDVDLDAQTDDGAALLDSAAVFAAEQFLEDCDDPGSSGLVTSVLGRRALQSLLALPDLGILTESAEFNAESLRTQLFECVGCNFPQIQDVNVPEPTLKRTLGTFSLEFTGSEAEDTEFTWDFGSDVIGSDRFSNEASPVLRMPEPGIHNGSVAISNLCTPPGFEAIRTFQYEVLDCDADPTFQDPPVVIAVEPIGDLITGTQVRFRAQVEGPTSEFTWDFGGGASPNISNAGSPTVTLGAAREAPYIGSVSAGNPCASAEPFIFEYIVTEECREGSALTVVSISPVNGVTDTFVEFNAEITGGTPTAFNWNFGGAGTPNTSTEAEPLVELGAIGTFTVSLTVEDECGPGETFTTTFTVREDCGVFFVTKPLTRGTGAEVFFFLDYFGALDPESIDFTSFDWDFGGGASPNASSAEFPQVILGAPGNYFGSVSFNATCFGPVEMDFFYEVFPSYIEFEYEGELTFAGCTAPARLTFSDDLADPDVRFSFQFLDCTPTGCDPTPPCGVSADFPLELLGPTGVPSFNDGINVRNFTAGGNSITVNSSGNTNFSFTGTQSGPRD